MRALPPAMESALRKIHKSSDDRAQAGGRRAPA